MKFYNDTKFMKKINNGMVFCLEYDKETLKDLVLEKQEEIERLNSIIKEVREYMKKQLELLPHYMYEAEMYKVLEILDKVEENK